MKIWDVDVDYIVISKLIETKNNSKYLIGYLSDVIWLLVLILPKSSRYVKSFKDKDGDKYKKNNNKLMSFHLDDDKLFEKYKTKIEDLQNIELNDLPVYNGRCIKAKITTYGDKVFSV